MDETVVDPSEEQRVGVLILRAWVDGPRPDGLRVRITSRLDVLSEDDAVSIALDTDTAMATIREWLDRFASG